MIYNPAIKKVFKNTLKCIFMVMDILNVGACQFWRAQEQGGKWGNILPY